jgi:hypothetical protein
MPLKTRMEKIVKLDSVTFDQLLGDQSPFQGDRPVCDLRPVRLITPAALVQLAAGSFSLARHGRSLLIRIDDESVRGYLARCGFFGVVSNIATIDPPVNGSYVYDLLRGSNPMLIEVTRIESGAALPDLLDQIVWVLQHRLKYKKFDAFDVATAVSEACQNTFDHNADTAGFLAMQVYGEGSRRFLEIGISDYGEGLATTLRRNVRNGPVPTDLAAIQLATQLGSSEHDDPTRGTGLYHLLEITYKHQGSVQIKSGAAKIRYRMDKRRGWSFPVPATSGVHLALTLPTKAAA